MWMLRLRDTEGFLKCRSEVAEALLFRRPTEGYPCSLANRHRIRCRVQGRTLPNHRILRRCYRDYIETQAIAHLPHRNIDVSTRTADPTSLPRDSHASPPTTSALDHPVTHPCPPCSKRSPSFPLTSSETPPPADLSTSVPSNPNKSKLKSSAQRAIRSKVLETYPALAPHIDAILPKKEQLDTVKLPDRCTLYTLPPGSASTIADPAKHESTPLFWQHMDDALVPYLRVVHAYPQCFSRVRVDRGAIRFVLSGAALMVPGLTSAGGRLPGDGKQGGDEATWGAVEEGDEESEIEEGGELEEGDVVAVFAEGKEHACCVGELKMGSKGMREAKKGVAIQDGHYLGDGLWKIALD